jgi:SAM-dependent methyltransferase
MNQEYTKLWTEPSFNSREVLKYRQKFFNRFENNIQHRQQVEFVRKFYHPAVKWLDFPIGAGRLFDGLNHKNGYGADISEEFLAYNRDRGHTTFKADINNFDLRQKFDLITCTHTLNFFPNFRDIIANFVRHLNPGGILIHDIHNAAHMEYVAQRGIKASAPHVGMSKTEIEQFMQSLGVELLEIRPHDHYDNFLVNEMFERNKKNHAFSFVYRQINRAYFYLHLFPLFNLYRPRKSHLYAKYLVAIRKKI